MVWAHPRTLRVQHEIALVPALTSVNCSFHFLSLSFQQRSRSRMGDMGRCSLWRQDSPYTEPTFAIARIWVRLGFVLVSLSTSFCACSMELTLSLRSPARSADLTEKLSRREVSHLWFGLRLLVVHAVTGEDVARTLPLAGMDELQ